MNNYKIEDVGNKRILIIGDKKYETIYSKKIIELIIARKGLSRAPEYLLHKEKRSYFFLPLFNYLNSKGLKNLKLLEIGCSAGQSTEFFNEQSCIDEVYTFDIDKQFVEIVKTKAQELGLQKVKSIDCFSMRETLNLPYPDDYFDLVIVPAVLEHLPIENRHMYVDEYYRKLKTGGVICFLDTPNRNYLLESHSIGLPFISKLGVQTAYIYAKLFGKIRNVDFPEFVRAGTGWRNATYYECLPKTLAADINDISEEVGYGYKFFNGISRSLKFKIFIKPFFRLLRFFSTLLKFPISFFLPNLNVIFKKISSYEK